MLCTSSASEVLRVAPSELGGEVLVIEASARGVVRIDVERSASGSRGTDAQRSADRRGAAAVVARRAADELVEYFAGQRQRFRTQVDFRAAGTTFQRRVWEGLLEIPFGEVVSYRDLARAVGAPRAVRAIGQAVGRNPVPIIVPCHRVVGSDGRLTGFGCGLPMKMLLLGVEGIVLGPRTTRPADRLVVAVG